MATVASRPLGDDYHVAEQQHDCESDLRDQAEESSKCWERQENHLRFHTLGKGAELGSWTRYTYRFPTVIEVDLVSITLNLEECSSPNNSGIQISLLETKPLNWKRKSIVSLTRIARGFSETNWPNHDTAPRVSLFFPWALAIVRTGILLYCVLTSPDELTRTRLLNSYSPAIEDGIVEYYDTNFENNFAHKTKYREPPSPEIEVVWNQIWKRKFVVFSMNRDLIGGIEVPLDCPARLGKATENLVHVDSDESRGYSVMLNNLIRQYTWRDDYNNHMGEWLEDEKNREIVDLNFSSRPSVGDRIHVDHCIETLRLQLMCNADLTPMLVFKDDTDALEDQAGFNVHHKCRYWDKGQSCRVATD
ncbi:hypothetical protein GGS21DRAFT_492484 [Xylaria nigripes]|nr:hypothetical protein GGS21DRAFT_492484 [Xylaria nigripes]